MRRLGATPPGRALYSQQTDDPDHDADLNNVHDQRGMILSILLDFLEEDRRVDLHAWIDHVGFDLTAIRYPADLPAAWVAHYRLGRGYDVDRALNDLFTFPPIADRIAFLSKQSKRTESGPTGRGKRRSQKLTD